MLLKKIGEEYKLYAEDDSCIATTQESPYKRLAKDNCDEIFGVVDVEKLADEYIVIKPKHREHEHNLAVSAYIEGFNKAMELNKDKLFTLEQFKQAIVWGYDKSTENIYLSRLPVDEFIQSLQQPTEIEVEIEMENYVKYVPKSLETVYPTGGVRPKLDENDCLILKKK